MAASDIRTPPTDAVFALHLPRQPGKCDWCGRPCEDRTPVRKQLRLRHYACDVELGIIVSPEQARRAVLRRDRGICCDCGLDCSELSRFRPTHPIGHEWHVDFVDDRGFNFGARERYPVVWLTTISMWHVDHVVPLWKVRHMPALQRIEYFKLANLTTRCDDCHETKSTKESGDRKHFRRLNNETKRPLKRKWPKGRKLRSRGFSKGE